MQTKGPHSLSDHRNRVVRQSIMNNHLLEVLNGKIMYKNFNLGKPSPTPPPPYPICRQSPVHTPWDCQYICRTWPITWDKEGHCVPRHSLVIVNECRPWLHLSQKSKCGQGNIPERYFSGKLTVKSYQFQNKCQKYNCLVDSYCYFHLFSNVEAIDIDCTQCLSAITQGANSFHHQVKRW
jgi:hypothetical protein